MKVEFIVRPWRGDGRVPMEEAQAVYCTGAKVDGIDVWAQGTEITIDAKGFMSLELRDIESGSWNRFMANHTPDDVLEGSGSPITEGDEVVGLWWEPGSSLIVPVTELSLVEAP